LAAEQVSKEDEALIENLEELCDPNLLLVAE